MFENLESIAPEARTAVAAIVGGVALFAVAAWWSLIGAYLFFRAAKRAATRATLAAGSADRYARDSKADRIEAGNKSRHAYVFANEAERASREALNSRSKCHQAAISCTSDAARAEHSANKSQQAASIENRDARKWIDQAVSILKVFEEAADTIANAQPQSTATILPFPSTLETPPASHKAGKPDPAPWNHTHGEPNA